MNYKQEILSLIQDSKITNEAACKAMGISKNTFKFNKSDGNPRNNFTEKHLTALKSFLIQHAKTITFAVKSNQLETYSKEDSRLINAVQNNALTNSELGKTK